MLWLLDDCPLADRVVVVRKGDVDALHLVPRASVLHCPLEALQLTALRGLARGLIVPGAPVHPRPDEHVQVASRHGRLAGALVPGAALLLGPLKHLQLAALRGRPAGVLAPGAALASASMRQGAVNKPNKWPIHSPYLVMRLSLVLAHDMPWR